MSSKWDLSGRWYEAAIYLQPPLTPARSEHTSELRGGRATSEIFHHHHVRITHRDHTFTRIFTGLGISSIESMIRTRALPENKEVRTAVPFRSSRSELRPCPGDHLRGRCHRAGKFRLPRWDTRHAKGIHDDTTELRTPERTRTADGGVSRPNFGSTASLVDLTRNVPVAWLPASTVRTY